MSQEAPRIIWHMPRTLEGMSTFTAPVKPEVEVARTGPKKSRRRIVESMIAQVGVPVVEGVKTAREWALWLLRLAAEFEHTLMVQYLYAGMSVPDVVAEDGIKYREKLVDIAIQEMGHLATVQNLLLLVGGPGATHFQRDQMRQRSGKNPIPFVLEPVDLPSLAKYVTAERPSEIPDEWAERVAQLVQMAKQDAGVPLKRVGVVYELLRWVFADPGGNASSEVDFAAHAPLPENPHLTDADLCPLEEIEPFLATREEWEAFEEDFLLFSASGRKEAIEAIEAIGAQGEGLLTDDASSHFEEFMQIADAFQEGLIEVTPIAKSPTLGANGAEEGVTITHPYTRLWGEVFSLQYTLVILSIHHAFLLPRTENGEGMRAKLSRSALLGMRRVLARLSGILGSLPARPDEGGLAGPPYDLDPRVLDESDTTHLRGRHLAILSRLSELYQSIKAEPDFAAHPDHATAVENLKRSDARHRDIFD